MGVRWVALNPQGDAAGGGGLHRGQKRAGVWAIMRTSAQRLVRLVAGAVYVEVDVDSRGGGRAHFFLRSGCLAKARC
jgi:hypothetical protein